MLWWWVHAGISLYKKVRQKQKHEQREEKRFAEHQGEGDLEMARIRDAERQEAVQQWGQWLGTLAPSGSGTHRL